MPKSLFNEAELVVVKSWILAEELEDTLEEIRRKYEELCERSLDAVIENHPELDVMDNRVNRGSGRNQGAILLSRSVWLGDKNYPSGFYFENLRLDHLVGQDGPPPLASLWISSDIEEDAGIKVAEVKRAIVAAAPSIFSAEESKRLSKSLPDSDYVFGFVVEKQELLEKLLESDGQGFCDTLISHLETLSKLIPKLNEVLVQKKVSAR